MNDSEIRWLSKRDAHLAESLSALLQPKVPFVLPVSPEEFREEIVRGRVMAAWRNGKLAAFFRVTPRPVEAAVQEQNVIEIRSVRSLVRGAIGALLQSYLDSDDSADDKTLAMVVSSSNQRMIELITSRLGFKPCSEYADNPALLECFYKDTVRDLVKSTVPRLLYVRGGSDTI